MRKYLLLHGKRILKILPFVLVVTAILFGSLAAAFRMVRQLDASMNTNVKFSIGVVGTAGDKYLSMGLAAFQSMDSMKLSVELKPMTEQNAQNAMRTRTIAAYIVFPEGFLDAAMRGQIMPIRYVSTAGNVDIVALVKDEVTQMVEQILWESQRGSFGVSDALWGNGLGNGSGKHLDALAIEYVTQVLSRSQLYTAEELGIGLGMDITGHLICSLSVLFLLLLCMPYAPLMIRSDRTMEKLLASRKIGPVRQVFAEFLLYFLSLLALTAVAALLIKAAGMFNAYFLDGSAFLKILPVVLCIAAWSFLCYEISRNMVSGVLLQFLSAVAMAFVGGCMYPAYFFPEKLQKIGALLPAGAARLQVAGILIGSGATQNAVLLLGYAVVFQTLSVAARLWAVRSDGR